MKKSVSLLLVFLGIVALLTICGWPSIIQQIWIYSHKQQQQELAKSLGVKIQDYPYQDYFPNGYFLTVLKPGMTHKEVHSIVRGYTSVVNCYGVDELYNYFGNNENGVLRYMVVYDNNGRFVELRTDSPGDRTLGADETCADGLLGN